MASKKLKKILKGAVPLLGAAGLAAALMGRKGRAFTNADARKLMTTNKAMRGSMIPMNPQMLSDELMQLNEGTDFGLGPLDMKKGGRVVKKTKGFSKKKKKQANRSKKK
jgi:hypothetical protein